MRAVIFERGNREAVDKMLEHGDGYTHGENFNRAVVLGLHLVALSAEGGSH